MQELLFQKHKEKFPEIPILLPYHPKDSRKQNIQVVIPGTRKTEVLVLNDIVEVSIPAAERSIKTDNWRLGYALTVHSSQGLTILDHRHFLQWSNLVYLAVSRVEYMSQLEKVVCTPEVGSEVRQTISEQQARKNIQKKLVSYKHQDRDKGREGFNLKVDCVLQLSEEQKNRCTACNIEMLWNYEPKDMQQFSCCKRRSGK